MSLEPDRDEERFDLESDFEENLRRLLQVDPEEEPEQGS